MSDYYKGVLFALFSASGFGIVPIMAIFAYNGGVGVFTLLFSRFLLASLILFIFIFLRKKKINLDFKNTLLLFIQGGVIYALFSMLYFTAVKIISPSLAVLIFYTYPIIVAVLSFILEGEKINAKIIISIIISFVGLVLLLGGQFQDVDKAGILMAAGAAVSYGIYTIYGSRMLKKVSLMVTTAFVSLFAGISFFVIGLMTDRLHFQFESKSWIFIIIITFITAAGFLAFFAGVKLIKPTFVSILSMIEPIVTIILSVILFSDKFSFVQALGSILVLSGASLIFIKKNILKNIKFSKK
ncbi:MAG: DMT family transporter [Bacillota bacterium]